MADQARETTRAEVENRMEAQATTARYNTYMAQSVYHMADNTCRHTPFSPSNMTGEELELVDAELSFLCGDDWCHQQLPNALWNEFFFDHMHYTVGEWLTSRDSDWLDGPPWLKTSLATWAGRDGENPYRFLLEDDEVQVFLADPPGRLVRPVR